jgi:hypothetical protein
MGRPQGDTALCRDGTYFLSEHAYRSGRSRNHIARVLADGSGALLGGTPTMPLPGQTKAESDQERIMLALERIASILQIINANLATVAKTMIDARPIGGSANGAVSRSGQIGA